jgi:CheY-like chemotaxis protein
MGWTVLCVSKSSPAQVTRNMILERAGYQIVAIDDPNEAVRIFKTSVVDAVVFGDSINGDQRVQLARAFKGLNRAVPIVALSKTSGSQFPAGLVDQHLESLGDPNLFLEAFQRNLTRDGYCAAKASASDQYRASDDGNGTPNAASAHQDHRPSTELSGSKAPKKSAI